MGPNTVARRAADILVLVLIFSSVSAGQRADVRGGTRARAVRGTTSITLVSEGLGRRYLLHVARSADPARPIPLVLLFHGGSDTPEHTETMTGLSALADREGFAIAYLEGIEKSWADGRGSTPSEKTGVDDVAFAKGVVADVRRRQALDPKRIYAAGPSNGGILTHLLACKAADVFAAIGPVIAGIASDVVPRCRPAAPISVIGIQAVADPVVPFAGGEVGEDLGRAHGGRIEGSRRTETFWRSMNGCAMTPSITRMPSRVKDGTSVSRREYAGCRGDVGVVWYEIEGGGHRWPPSELTGVRERLVARKLGVSSQNLDATSVLWEFFNAHPKP